MNLKTVFSGRKNLPLPKLDLEFDFVVAERPIYIPGSGPPLAPVLAMPPRDRDGYIIKELMLYSELRYLVGFEELPHLRVSVKPTNILNWISPRAFEEYHINKYDAAERERENTELPMIEAKEERRRKRMEKLSRAGLPEETQSRKRKRKGIPIDEVEFKNKKPGGLVDSRRRNQPAEEGMSFTSPKQSEHSQRQPSLSAGGLANRTVLDSDSDDEGSMATETALEYQLKGGRNPPSNFHSSRSTSTSPPHSKHHIRSRSVSKPIDTSREESPLVSTPSINHLSAPDVSGKSAVAATSSREALRVYEDLERKNLKPQTIADKYSYTRKNTQSKTFKGAHIGLTSRTHGLAQVATDDAETDEPEEEEEAAEGEESEYEMDCILDDDIRHGSNGEEEIWYLIKWAGDWDDTWEPSENIGNGAIQEYENDKRKQKGKEKLIGENGAGEESDPDSLFVSDWTGKVKKVKRGQVIDDCDDDSEDDEMQWASGP